MQTDGLVFFPRGKEKLPIINPGPDFELVLIGFDFAYRGNDHHIDEVGVLQEDENTLTVFFNDKNDDDPGLSRIEYAWVPKSLIASTGVATGTSSGGGARESIPNGIRVIRGFKLDYTNQDHHLKEIGVLTTSTASGDLEVYYSDRNQDDEFDWEVRWAILKPSVRNPGRVVLDGINHQFKAALERNDAAGLDSLMSDSLVVMDGDRAIADKTGWLEMVKSGDLTYKLNDEEPGNVSVFGNTAIVSGRGTVTKLVDRREVREECRLARTYLFDGQQWRVIAIQASPAAKEQP